MRIDLSGKTALISGSTKGIGYAIARHLARAGADVIVNGRTSSGVDHAVGSLRGEVPEANVTGATADVGTPDGCDALVASVPSVDILINNVGIFGPRDFFETPDATWMEFFDVNVMSGVRLSRAYLPGMVEREWGRVLFISSESALNIPPDMIHYGFTKTANLSISRGLAKRVAGTGVTVNAILPGPTRSDGFESMVGTGEDADETAEEKARSFVMEHRPSSIIRRAATVDEVANMVVYAASPQASATTGAGLRVDGGVVETIA